MLILITIILQFTFSIALIISSLVVIKQTRIATKADLGFSVEYVLSIPINQRLGNNFEGFLEPIESNPDVEMVIASLATLIAIWRSVRQNPADLIKQE